MTTALMVSFLLGHQFQSACLPAPDQGQPVFVIEKIIFNQKEILHDHELAFVIIRQFFTNSNCTLSNYRPTIENGVIALGDALPQDGLIKKAEADFYFKRATGESLERGAIGIDDLAPTLSLARNAAGYARNTTLSKFKFYAKKRNPESERSAE